MIEKIMKAVKSGNKKRGRNITVGAVVGSLLSCTAVIGADDNYLWIKEDGGAIKFNTGVTTDVDGNGGNWSTDNTYTENAWDAATQTYTNNMTLSSSKNNGNNGYNDISYGFRLSGDLSKFNFINNGLIATTGNTRYGYGIYNSAVSMETLTNSGLVVGTSSSSGYGINSTKSIEILRNNGLVVGTGGVNGYGIYIDYGISIGSLINSGLIVGIAGDDRDESGYGIYQRKNSTIKTLTNNGLIVGKSYQAYGIEIGGKSIESLTNSGLIAGIRTSGYSGGYGIHVNYANVITLTNNGVIFGNTNAIRNHNSVGKITSANNYGILAGDTAVDGLKVTNYGIYITGNLGTVTAGIGGSQTVKFGNSERGMTIKNAVITGGSGIGTSTESFELSGNPTEFDNSILNGKNETLKITGTEGEVKGSVINAYGTAVVFGEVDKKLTLSGTIVNGGVDETNKITVSGSSGGDTLILQSGEVGYVGGSGSTGTQNTVINGNIAMEGGADTVTVDTGAIINGNVDMGADALTVGKGAAITGKINMAAGDDILTITSEGIVNGDIDMGTGADTLTIEAGSIINGILDGGADNDILNFNSAVTRAVADGGMNILHNLSGFENINVNSNVTLFEKTVKDDGSVGDLTVTDAENITIGANGILTLRIDSSKVDSSSGTDKIIGHALYENNGTITSTGGKLLLALNGAGNESIISFGTTQLDESLVTGSKGNFDTTSKLHTIESLDGINEVKVVVRWSIPEIFKYKQLNKIYHGILSVDELGNFNVDDDEKLLTFLSYLNDIYAGNPYSYSGELSRKSVGMFRDIVTDNQFKANTGKWMIYGGLTHVDGGTKDTYYGKGYYTYDIGSSDMDADTKITGAYMLGEYGISDTLTSGVVIGGNKLKSDLSNGSKVDGSALYLGGYAKKYIGNLKVIAGAGFQYGDYDADRLTVNKVASDSVETVMKYSDNYNDITYDIYLNGRYSHQVGDNLFLEPYATLSYTYIDQDGANEGSKVLAIETDSKSFDYTVGKVGVDLKKVIPHEKGKSTLSAGISYTKILDGADEEHITGRFKGGSNFDILVAHKNEHSIGLNAKYALELENGVLFDVKGTYSVERDSHNQSGKNRTKGEWIVGAGLGYKF